MLAQDKGLTQDQGKNCSFLEKVSWSPGLSPQTV